MSLKSTKILFAATITAPTFLSLGLIGIVKDSTQYIEKWNDLFYSCVCPNSFEWWAINLSFLFLIVCLIGINCYLNNKQRRLREAITITAESYSNMAQIGTDQILSSIIPWLTVFAGELDFKVLFACIVVQCCIISVASYNNSNYNMLCSILGYRYYQVKTKENTYILISKKCIRNKKEITRYAEITDYMGLLIY